MDEDLIKRWNNKVSPGDIVPVTLDEILERGNVCGIEGE